MSSPLKPRRDGEGEPISIADPNPPTVASFSPVTLSHAVSANKQRSTILVHQKSPLLIATPPQITRALAYSHPFLLPLNKLVGLLTWTTGDPWESFLLLASFWGIVLYGDAVMRWAGPVMIVIALILGMYSRRYSPLSSTGWTGEKGQKKGHKRAESEVTNTKHQKTLDEIVDSLKEFTSRCNVLLDPLLELTDFLSTQQTATSATTRPALTTLLIRILLITPFWIILTLPPIQIITAKRLVLVGGTLFLTYHSKPQRVSRVILWRSGTVRQLCAAITGLNFAGVHAPSSNGSSASPIVHRRKSAYQEEASLAANLAVSAASRRRPDAPGVRFTFILYENQRRWVGIGWTTSLFPYERSAWTDEHLNSAPSKDTFELPDVENGLARWRWVQGSKWLVEGAGEFDEGGSKPKSGSGGGQGWIYYDNKWKDGRRGQDGWGKYTRRRKWYRDAELVEISPSTEITPSPTPTINSSPEPTPAPNPTSEPAHEYAESVRSFDSTKSVKSTHSKSSGFRPESLKRSSLKSRTNSFTTESDEERPPRPRHTDWGIGDDARMGLE
ncbi:hypothetical protein OIDMADRAFT_53654 [Oidiodendron maius Zn]|uniref:Peroxin/Ferlin domain-containing protein n=1 Tax=Oidiodendron maius (strain Zn) TaxID=913774 RepID=A0A0C3H1X8_OIDMZ|nr:hypothetical protein OIDMADRAFT_53654 [Oidiodendron maius Zn]